MIPSPKLGLPLEASLKPATMEVESMVKTVLEVLQLPGIAGLAVKEFIRSTESYIDEASAGVKTFDVWNHLLYLPHVRFSISGRFLSKQDPVL